MNVLSTLRRGAQAVRSRTPDAVIAFLAIVAIMVFLGLTAKAASAATVQHPVHPTHHHYNRALHHVKVAPAISDDGQADPLLSTDDLNPEQQAMLAWAIDNQKNLSPTLGERIVRTVYQYAELRHLDPMLVLSLVRLESRFNPRAVSKDGSMGLMQVRVSAHREKLHGRSPFNVRASVEVGTQILSDCMDKANGSLFGALNCYSGGGGKTYYAYYQAAQHKANHYLVEQLFTLPPVTESTPPVDAALLSSN